MPKSGKKTAKSDKSTAGPMEPVVLKDPLPQPLWLPPPEFLGERLLNAVEYKPLEERDLFGLKISKRAIMNLTPAEIRNLYEVFSTFDRNETGYLKAKELFYAMKTLGFSITPKLTEDYIEAEAIDQNIKALNFNQFLDLIIDKQGSAADHHDEILNVFKLFDYDNINHLSIDNLRKACQETELELTETELREMIMEADQNGDGLVDESEFIAIMLRTNLY